MLYPAEQTHKLFEQLPPELRVAILSQDTADAIRQTCERHKIVDQMSDLAILTGNVLLGLLSPGDLAASITQEMKIPAAKAKIISQEINRLVFYPVKDKLAELYQAANPSFAADMIIPGERPVVAKRSATAGAGQNDTDDTYREAVD